MHRLLPLFFLPCTALAQQSDEVQAAWAEFQRAHGTSWTAEWNPATGTPRAVFGPGLRIAGALPDTASARRHAEALLAEQAGLLGRGASTFVETTGTKVRQVHYFIYQQQFRGLEVIDARADVRIHEAGVVSLFGASAVSVPAGFGIEPAISGDAARRVAEQHVLGEPAAALLPGAAPRLVIWAQPMGSAPASPALAWEVQIDNRPTTVTVGKVYVDARTSAVLEFRNEVYTCSSCNKVHVARSKHDERLHAAMHRVESMRRAPANPPLALTGTVMAWTNTGLKPTDPLTQIPLANLQVTSSAGNAFTDASGNFSIAYTGTTPVLVTATLTGRHSQRIRVQQGAQLTASATITPGTPATIVFGSQNMGELDWSQTTAYYHVDDINEWCRALLPTQTAAMNRLSGMNPRVNIPSSCNAYYTGFTINFYNQSSTCNMTAYSTVIYHEWGHGFDDAFGGISRTDGLSEGWADVVAILRTQQPIVGDAFRKNGGFVRTATNNLTYPVNSTSVHTQGQVWMGWVWDVRLDLVARLGQAAGEKRVTDIVISSIVADATSMAAQIREVFIQDDDDGNLNNGTPNYASLEKASLKRTVPYPQRLNPNAGTYVTFGSGCPGSGQKAGTGCLNVNDTGAPQNFGTRANLTYAVLATAPAPLDVLGFELYTSVTGGRSVPTRLYAADAAGNPAAVLATGTMAVGGTPNWYQTTFASPVRINQGQRFFVAFENNTQTIAASIRTGTGTPYFRNDGPGGSWNGPLAGFSWAYRINCPGGPGAVPVLSATGVPELNKSFSVELAGANPNAAGFLLFGVSDTTWSGNNLPLDLARFGAAGCTLLTSVDVLLGMRTSAAGTASLPFTVPNVASNFGLTFFNQFAISDGANGFGVVFSNGGKAKVGKD